MPDSEALAIGDALPVRSRKARIEDGSDVHQGQASRRFPTLARVDYPFLGWRTISAAREFVAISP